jgi:hypothetical protein
MAIVVLCLTTVTTADIYRYRGSDGRLIISNTPPPPLADVKRSRHETTCQEVSAQTTEPVTAPAQAASAQQSTTIVVQETPPKKREPQRTMFLKSAPPPVKNGDVFDVDEAAALLKVSKQTILPALKPTPSCTLGWAKRASSAAPRLPNGCRMGRLGQP